MAKLKSAVSGEDASVRAKLLAAAAARFSQQGYAATSVREIVEAAGVTKPVLYYYFRSKEGIFQALLDEAIGQFLAAVDEVESIPVRPPEKVRALMDRLYDIFVAHADVGRIVNSYFYGPASGTPVFDVRSVHDRFEASLLAMVKEGMRQGDFRPGDPADVTRTVAALFALTIDDTLCDLHAEKIGREGLQRLITLLFDGIAAHRPVRTGETP